MRIAFASLAVAVCAAVGIAQSTLTTFTTFGTNQGNSGGAIFFNLTVTNLLTINQINFNAGLNTAANTPGTLQVWLGPQTRVGNEQNQSLWTLVSTGTVTGTSANNTMPLTPAPLSPPIGLAPGQYGVALVAQGFNHGYTTGALTASNADLAFVGGAAQNVPWTGSVFQPRSFNGSFDYTLGGTPIAVASTETYGTGCYAWYTSLYEHFPNTALGYDLGGSTTAPNAIKFSLASTPNGPGYNVTQVASPTWFTPTSVNIPFANGQVVPQAMSFPILFPDPTAAGGIGASNQLYISDDGFVSPKPFSTPPTVPAAVAAFLNGPLGWAPNYYNMDPGLAGTIHYDEDLTSALPAAYVTWNGVASIIGATVTSTFQLALFANGDVEFRWGQMAAGAGGGGGYDTIVGWTTGNGAANPGQFDLSANLPTTTEGGDNLPLTLTLGSRPLIGSTINFNTANIPAGTVFGILLLSFVQLNPGMDLTGLGMPGCLQFAQAPGTVNGFFVAGSTASQSLAIPNNPALNGTLVFGQTATFTPGFNPAGILASNGLRLRTGTL